MISFCFWNKNFDDIFRQNIIPILNGRNLIGSIHGNHFANFVITSMIHLLAAKLSKMLMNGGILEIMVNWLVPMDLKETITKLLRICKWQFSIRKNKVIVMLYFDLGIYLYKSVTCIIHDRRSKEKTGANILYIYNLHLSKYASANIFNYIIVLEHLSQV